MSPVMFVINKRFAVLSLPNLRSGVLFSGKRENRRTGEKGTNFFPFGFQIKKEEGPLDRRLSPSRFCRSALTKRQEQASAQLRKITKRRREENKTLVKAKPQRQTSQGTPDP